MNYDGYVYFLTFLNTIGPKLFGMLLILVYTILITVGEIKRRKMTKEDRLFFKGFLIGLFILDIPFLYQFIKMLIEIIYLANINPIDLINGNYNKDIL